MPKLSISIPDPLWKRVVAHEGHEVRKPSEFVQRVIGYYLEESQAPQHFRPEGTPNPDRLQAVIASLVSGYQERWKAGYEDGLTFVEKAGSGFFETLGRKDELFIHEDMLADHPTLSRSWALVHLPNAIDSNDEPGDVDPAVEKYIWCHDFLHTAVGSSSGDDGEGDTAYRDGAEQALQDVWAAYQKETAGERSGS